jgi:pentalenene oxygenase
LARLDLTNRVITETLRIAPPGWMLTRKTTTQAQLGGHTLPPGTTLICSPYCLGRHRDLYQQPAEFNPDRWRHGSGLTLPRGALVPFSAGARKCMGDEYAMAMAITAVTAIARRWRLEHLPGAVVRPVPRGLLTPHALHMRLHQQL